LGFPEILRHARLAHVLSASSLFALYIAKLTQAPSPRNRTRFESCRAEYHGYSVARFPRSGYDVALRFCHPRDM